MCDVVGVHARNERGPRLCDDGVRTAGESELLFAFVKTYTTVARRPLSQSFARPIGRGIVEDYELEIIEGLREDAVDAGVKKRQRVIHRHNNADERVRWKRHTMYDALV